MKILAIDIGAGTQDILLYDEGKGNIENCVKMVLPAPSIVFAGKVRQATILRKDLFAKGAVMGGGAFTHALQTHLKAQLKVFMTEEAAYTVRNDLNQVRAMGITTIHHERELKAFDGETLEIKEIDLTTLGRFLGRFGDSLADVDVVAIAVQDHGMCPTDMSNRRFRIRQMQERLKGNAKPEALAFREEEIPRFFLRMKSAAAASRRQLATAQVLVMDTALDAILGCLKDPLVEKADPVLAVNVGNGHTMAAIVAEGSIVGMLEHHTRLLTPKTVAPLLVKFADGKLSDETVFEDQGHGLFFLATPPGFKNLEKVVVTGPNRRLLAHSDLPVYFSIPAGDVMMTGPIGLVEVVKRKFPQS